MSTSLFPIGRVLVTAGVNALMVQDDQFMLFVIRCLDRYMQKDFGELERVDLETNLVGLELGLRLFGSYWTEGPHMEHGDKIYIITEADRSTTTILWPSEY